MNISELHKLFLEQEGLTTDTRKITQKTIYFALKGDNFNGNLFANEAIKKGASYVVVDENITYDYNESKYIKVKDVLETLQNLATYHRSFLNIPIIALTGSNGKTTTKELIDSVLSTTYKTTATIGNLNNHIGVPLTLLSMTKDTEIGIVEMGANHKKEIEALCNIALPDFGYITNFGKAHLEGFGGFDGVIEGKSEIYNYLINNNKLAFYNTEDDIQVDKLKSYNNKIGFGTKDSENINYTLLNTTPFIVLSTNNTQINSNLIGEYNFTNICAACTIGTYFKIDNATIKNGIENYVPNNNRSQILKKGNHKIILDAYNANPSSMTAALNHFESIPKTNKIVFLGDMFELGKTAPKEHQNILNKALTLNLNKIILIGEHFYHCKTESENVLQYKSFKDFKGHFTNLNTKDTLILIKGSRGMALERILEEL